MHNRLNAAKIFPTALAALLFASLGACRDPLPEPVDRTGHLDTIAFAAELGIEPDSLERVASKLYIRDLREGTGATIQKGQILRAHMEGWLPSGEKFVDSRADGEALEFAHGFGELIRGLDLGMAGMRIGGKRRVIVPPAMAYGTRGTDVVPPFATLVFDVEVVGDAR